MELQIPHCIYTEISKTNNIQANISRYRAINPSAMCQKRSRDNRSGSNARSYPLIRIDATKIQRIGICRIPKGKSSLMIFDRHANLKYKYGNRHFWCRGYYVDTVGRNEKTIKEYVRNRHQEDIASDQICMKEFTDPFTGEPVGKGK